MTDEVIGFMRPLLFAVVMVVSTGCALPVLSGGGNVDRGERCNTFDACLGGTGTADGYVAVAVAGAILTTIGVATYRHLTSD